MHAPVRISLKLIAGVLAAAGLASQAAAQGAAPAPQPDYHPSMGDLMTTAVQPRHTKIGLAGAERNWAYATYEISELRNAFNRIARTIPMTNGSDTAALVSTRIKEPIDRVEAAIKAKDAKGFDTAYVALTKACNTCHETQNKQFVVIKAPSGSPYPDQDFHAGK